MRSHGGAAGQEPLPFVPPTAVPTADGRRRPARSVDAPFITLGDELARARGWPAGTEVLVDPTRRPARADVVVVREDGVLVAGLVDQQFGRPVLRNDLGVVWIGLGADVVGVVTVVAPALDEMPPRSPPASECVALEANRSSRRPG